MVLLSLFLICIIIAEGKKHCFQIHRDENGDLYRLKNDYSLLSENGYLTLNGDRFNLKGASWFGFETSTYVVHGLWCNDYHFYIDFLSNYSFNAVRIPFSVEMVQTNPIPTSINTFNMNQDLTNLTSLQVLDKIIIAMAEKGILILLDMQSLQHDGYMQNVTIAAWEIMINRYKQYWNVIGIDVFNEPCNATWATGDNKTDFDIFCTLIGNKAHALGADWLIFCEGTQHSPPTSVSCACGEDLEGVKTDPIQLNIPNKVVYSPHVYESFITPSPPPYGPSIWDKHFGFIRDENKSATCVGEWGGQMNGQSLLWMDTFATYLVEHDIPDTFFWCLNSDIWFVGWME